MTARSRSAPARCCGSSSRPSFPPTGSSRSAVRSRSDRGPWSLPERARPAAGPGPTPASSGGWMALARSRRSGSRPGRSRQAGRARGGSRPPSSAPTRSRPSDGARPARSTSRPRIPPTRPHATALALEPAALATARERLVKEILEAGASSARIKELFDLPDADVATSILANLEAIVPFLGSADVMGRLLEALGARRGELWTPERLDLIARNPRALRTLAEIARDSPEARALVARWLADAAALGPAEAALAPTIALTRMRASDPAEVPELWAPPAVHLLLASILDDRSPTAPERLEACRDLPFAAGVLADVRGRASRRRGPGPRLDPRPRLPPGARARHGGPLGRRAPRGRRRHHRALAAASRAVHAARGRLPAAAGRTARLRGVARPRSPGIGRDPDRGRHSSAPNRRVPIGARPEDPPRARRRSGGGPGRYCASARLRSCSTAIARHSLSTTAPARTRPCSPPAARGPGACRPSSRFASSSAGVFRSRCSSHFSGATRRGRPRSTSCSTGTTRPISSWRRSNSACCGTKRAW